MNVNIVYAVILHFPDFHLRGKKKYVLKYPFRQDIFKQTYRNVVITLRDYIWTLALYTVHTRV